MQLKNIQERPVRVEEREAKMEPKAAEQKHANDIAHSPETVSQYIWSHRNLIIMITLVGSAAIIWGTITQPITHSTAHIFIQPEKTEEVAQGSMVFPEPSASVQWVISELRSTAYHERLNEEFGLVELFGLDPSDEYVDAKYERAISSRLQINTTDQDMVDLTVSNIEPHLGSKIANGSVDYLNERALELFSKRQERIIAASKLIAQANRDRIKVQTEDLTALLKEISSLKSDLTGSLGLETRVMGLMNRLEQSNLEQMRSQEIQEISKVLTSMEGPMNIYLSKKATPEPNVLSAFQLVTHISLTVVFSFVTVVLAFGLWRYKRDTIFADFRSFNHLEQ